MIVAGLMIVAGRGEGVVFQMGGLYFPKEGGEYHWS